MVDALDAFTAAMSLGRDIAEALPGLRAEAESMMRDTCIVTDGDATPVWNPVTLEYEYTATTVYEGPCRVRFANVMVGSDDAAGQLFAEHAGTLSLPFSVPESADVVKGNTVTVTASASDAALVGATYTITASRRQSDATARRFPIEETQ